MKIIFTCWITGNKQYYVINSLTTFSQAAKICTDSGMNIATPQTQAEFNDILRFYAANVRSYGKIEHDVNNKAFIGIQKDNDQWVELASKSSIKYNITWFPGNPSGDGPCTDLVISDGGSGLNDIPCETFPRNFICEKTGR